MKIDRRGTDAWWAVGTEALLCRLGTNATGLTEDQARQRAAARPDGRREPRGFGRCVAGQLRSPLQLVLIVGGAIAAVVQEWTDAAVITGIVLLSAVLAAWHEYRASRAIDALREHVSPRARVIRDGRVATLPHEAIVPGDVVELAAGSLVPADGVLLEAHDCQVDQAVLTGETLPVTRAPGPCPAQTTLARRRNCLFSGTSVRSGTARMLVVSAGDDTVVGRLAASLASPTPETEFERGLRQFGNVLLRIMVVTVLLVLLANTVLARPALDTLLFAVALAVGLSPELLPAILGLMLARGAQQMARRGVIVRKLNAIENLGAMDVLCTDKTGTLTRGVMQLDAALDADGMRSESVLRDAYVNASLQQGLQNPLDEAVVAAGRSAGLVPEPERRLGEIPYDFVRRRLSVRVRSDGGRSRLVTKGALESVLAVCTHRRQQGDTRALDDRHRDDIRAIFTRHGHEGFRVLGVATRELREETSVDPESESGLTFEGFLLFLDPPDPGVREVIAALRRRQVRICMITGDNRLVARHVGEAVGLDVGAILTGSDLARLDDDALRQEAARTTVFAEVDPEQKQRVIVALRAAGHAVGYLGDGINDAPALHAADVGISVAGASDVAREAADLVLLEKDLDVLRAGIDEGRVTFANTLKYLFITTSANLGNMLSMAMASLFLPFLPLLAKQILLNNFLSDIPAMAISSDRVDEEWEAIPHRWDVRVVARSMLVFGLISTVFDLLTFGVLYVLSERAPDAFRTGWFVESLLTEIAIIFVLRTARPFWRGRASPVLVGLAGAVGAVSLMLPWMPGVGSWFAFVPLPLPVIATIVGITALYALASEQGKRALQARVRPR